MIIKFTLRKFLLFILTVATFQLFSNISFSIEPEEILKNQTLELRAREISKNVRCLVCQNQSIDESNALLAKDLRLLIREKLKNGLSDKEIYKFLTDRYGDFILLQPPFKLNTIILWFLPLFLFTFGIIFIFFHNKKYKQIKKKI